MANDLSPRTDIGTVILHWMLVGAVLVLLATGLRIAADGETHAWLSLFDPVLPVEDLWFRHMLAGVWLTAVAAGYVAYIASARLTQRVRLDLARLKGLAGRGRVRWSALNTVLVWLMFASLGTEIVTGIMLYLGIGGAILGVHLWATWTLLIAVGLHVAGHWKLGGLPQLLRIIRPSAVPKPQPTLPELVAEQLESLARRASATKPLADRGGSGHVQDVRKQDAGGQNVSGQQRANQINAHPLAVAAAAALSACIAAGVVEQSTRTTLSIPVIATALAPRIDGDLSDPAWSNAKAVSVMTLGGANFGGTGQSQVDVKAVHDGRYVYMAITWTDPTRSLKHLPLVKHADGWRLVESGFDTADENRYHEDKFSVLLARDVRALIGAAIHLSPAPLRSVPGSMPGRGLHFTTGAILDVWQWRAASGPGGTGGDYVEDGYFGPLLEPDSEQMAGRRRYAGGFALDPGTDGAALNFVTEAPGGYRGPLTPFRLPADPTIVTAALGRIDDAPDHSESEGALWCLPLAGSVPYSKAADARFAPGSVIPGVVSAGIPGGDRGNVRSAARWAAGRWTMEIVRALDTGSAFDTPVANGTLMWVAAFDHAQTRHTRHLRPIRLELQ